MPLVKRRRFEDALLTNASTQAGSSGAPFLLLSHAAPHANTDTFLRLRFQFCASVQVDPSDPPPKTWWPVSTMLLIAWWSDTGSTAIGPSFGTSEHYLGSKLLTPRLTVDPHDPADSYVVTYQSDSDLVTETYRKGSGSATPHVGVGLAIYDPYNAFNGTYTSVAINWQVHMFSLWGSLT